MLELDDLESECCPLPMPTSGPHPTPVTIPSDPQSGHHTYTSHMVIADELKVHAERLRGRVYMYELPANVNRRSEVTRATGTARTPNS